MKRKAGDSDRIRGARVRKLRKAQELSLAELGRRIGVTYQQISKYERGEDQMGPNCVLAIAAALNTTTDAIYGPSPSADFEQVPTLALHVADNSKAMLYAENHDLCPKLRQISDAHVRGLLSELVSALAQPRSSKDKRRTRKSGPRGTALT